MSPSRVLKVYYASRFQRTRLLSWIAAVFDGFWLGVLDRRHLDALDDAFYRGTRETHTGNTIGYADAEYTQRGLEPWEQAYVAAHVPSESRILVTGAGGGREVWALLEQGHDATGYEPNVAFVEGGAATLAAQGHPGRLHVMPRDGFPVEEGEWDAVIVGWGSYMSIPGRATRITFLRQALAHTAPGGSLLVSGWYRPDDSPYDRTVARVGSAIRRALRRPPLDVGDALIDCFQHRFTRKDLEGEAREAGFVPVEFGHEPCAWLVARAPG